MKRRTILLPLVPALIAGGVVLHHRAAQAQRPVVFMCNGIAQGSPNCPPPTPVLKGFFKVHRSHGALAYDEAKSIWFGSYQYPSKSEAQKGVLTNCEENGGSACKLMLTYTNQCAAVVRAVSDGKEVIGQDTVDTGSTQEEAEARASDSCRSDWGVAQCSVKLVNCSHHGVTRWKEWVYE